MFDKWESKKRIEFIIIDTKSATMIDKLLIHLDGNLGGMIMNIDGNVIKTLLTSSRPMAS